MNYLNEKSFLLIIRTFGIPDIDIFASKANAKCLKYVSWDRVIQKIISDKAIGILVVPNWPTQSWYPIFLNLLLEDPIIFEASEYLISSPFREKHPLYSSFFPASGEIGGESLKRKEIPKSTIPIILASITKSTPL